ncbi:MAG TPA: RraA family protein, partial [Candidatus Methylomirabilis sp.]|nr:RraA family protein [Candidatus Methylomirabilis sp.]
MATQLTAGQLEELRSVDSPTVANAIEVFKVRDDTEGYMGMDIPCLTPEFGVMVGYAVTITADSTTPGRARSRQGHIKVYDALVASPKPAVLVVQDVGTKRTHACFLGDVIATLSRRLSA